MRALQLVRDWPVPNVSAASVVLAPGTPPDIATEGDATRPYRIASISQAARRLGRARRGRGRSALPRRPHRPAGCTLRHLLAHAGGYPFDGPDPITTPGKRRIYSNTGIELAADAVSTAAQMPFRPLPRRGRVRTARHDRQRTAAAHPLTQVWSTVDDLVRFTVELARPTLLSAAPQHSPRRPCTPTSRASVPGVGRFSRCSWGLGFEVHGDKQPHWMGTSNSPGAFGHFGGAGTLLWVDLGAVHERAVGLRGTDRPPLRRLGRHRAEGCGPSSAMHSSPKQVPKQVPTQQARRSAAAPPPASRRPVDDAPAGRSCACGDHGRRRVPGREVRLRRWRHRPGRRDPTAWDRSSSCSTASSAAT